MYDCIIIIISSSVFVLFPTTVCIHSKYSKVLYLNLQNSVGCLIKYDCCCFTTVVLHRDSRGVQYAKELSMFAEFGDHSYYIT